MSNLSLMNIMQFDEFDLEANRRGYMTEKQRHKLLFLALISSIVPLIFIGVCAMFFNDSLKELTIDKYPPGETTPWLLPWQMVAAGIGDLIGTIILIKRWLFVLVDLRSGHIDTCVGEARIAHGEMRNLGYYGAGIRISFRWDNFILPYTARNAFFKGKIYRVYFTPYSRIVMSIEEQE